MLDLVRSARRSRRRPAPSRRAWVGSVMLALACAFALLTVTAGPASAHVVPTSSVRLQVGADSVTAVVAIPLSDLEAATGLDLGDQSQAAADGAAAAIDAYLVAHIAPTSDDGRAWSVAPGGLTVGETGDQATTGLYRQLQTTVTLTPPAGASVRSFNLGYDAIVDRVATHVVVVTVSSDWSGGSSGTYEAGVIRRDTVTGAVEPLHLDLGPGSNLRGFASMVTLGMQHIAEGTDHQLFLLTLLLPAPLLARRRRWAGPAPTRQAVRRIATITAAFTLGHSATLALGALGVPVPQQAVEALIAVSILVAAGHAIRPLFPGREALVAAAFGLVHGLAFSAALRELDLTGTQLVLSLLGFNLGIEAMQLVVVALILPALVLLARAGRYQALRTTAAGLTALAATGWLGARLGATNPVADAADQLGVIAVPLVVLLWSTALMVSRSRRVARDREPASGALVARRCDHQPLQVHQ